MSKSVKEKLVAVISSLKPSEFMNFFQEYLNTLKETNIKFEREI